MLVTFQKATKTQSRLRMALDGPSGSGKTYTGLVFATALAQGIGNGRVAVIDTERGSAAKYADRFDFDVLALEKFAPQLYRDAIEAAEKAGYPVILIDSLSHAWEGEGGILDLHDQATKRQPSQNSFTAWKDVTPIHRKLVDTILTSSAHIIVTMRSKMDYVQSVENGKTVIRKVGMEPVQRQGIAYEFDIVGDLDTEHNMSITKSRCFAVTDAVVNKPTADWFKVIKDWLTEGVAAPERKAPSTPQAAANGNDDEDSLKRRAELMIASGVPISEAAEDTLELNVDSATRPVKPQYNTRPEFLELVYQWLPRYRDVQDPTKVNEFAVNNHLKNAGIPSFAHPSAWASLCAKNDEKQGQPA